MRLDEELNVNCQVDVIQEVSVQLNQRDAVFTQLDAFPITEQFRVYNTELWLRLQQLLNDKVCEGLLLISFAVVKQMDFNFFVQLISSQMRARKLQ